MGKSTEFNVDEFGGYDPELTKADYSTHDPPTYSGACMGMMVCPHCGRAAMCSDIPNIGEKENMIPRNNSNNQQANNSGQRRPTGYPFLGPDKVSTDKQPGLIVGARMEEDAYRKGQQVVALKIEYQRAFFRFNLRTNNPVLEDLCRAFGDDETKWTNLPIYVFKEIDEHNGKEWMRLEPRNNDEAPMQLEQRNGNEAPITAARRRR